MTGAELAAPRVPPVEGRLRLLAIGHRTVLTALATLGGDASDAAIDALCDGTGAPKVAAVQARAARRRLGLPARSPAGCGSPRARCATP